MRKKSIELETLMLTTKPTKNNKKSSLNITKMDNTGHLVYWQNKRMLTNYLANIEKVQELWLKIMLH